MIVFLIFFLIGLLIYFLRVGVIIEWLLFNLNSINIEFFVLLDWISVLFIRVVILISSIIILYSIIYIEGEIFLNRFVKLVILFVLSIVLIVIRPNLIRILFGWDGLGLISYCLVIFYQNYMAYNSGLITVLCNRVGDIGLLISIRLMFMYGRWNLYILEFNKKLILLIILLAAITKRAQIPFSVWLPLAMAAPTPVSALVHSSTLVTAGVYLMIRYNKFIMRRGVDKFLFYISIFTMFISGFIANLENDLKKIIALSTLSQLGLIIIILSLGLKFLAFYHLLTHAIFKSLLFICAGIIIHLINNNQDIRFCGKLNEFIPFTMLRFYVSSLALLGFPFLAGFYSKDLIIEIIYLININLLMLIMIILSLSFTVSYSFRLFYYIYFGEINRRFLNFKENILINLSILFLLMLRLVRGSVLNWIFFYDRYITFIKVNLKILTIIILILGLIFGIVIYIKNLLNFYFYRFFFRSIWFINYIYIYIYKPYFIRGQEGYEIDKNWIEFFRKNLFLGAVKEIKVNLNLIKIFIFIFVILFILLIIFIIF